MSDEEPPLHVFEGVGIELEFMIVDRDSLSVRPIADRLLHAASGGGNDVERGSMGWSNELVLHVIEVKNIEPSTSLAPLPALFHTEIQAVNEGLAPLGAQLMPGAMHPWMNPELETRIWPHDNHSIYAAYDRIFGCSSHGWANLQSMHINLPFTGDAEFARLHAAIRLALPILPALAASSPIADGRDSDWADYRMRVYCDNAPAIPILAGMVVPDTVTSRTEYQRAVLAPMYSAIAPHDPEGALRYEWLNSHGAIARFDRDTIEIRVIDTQECPRADLAIAAATCALVRRLYDDGESTLAKQQRISTGALASILQDCMRDAERTRIDNTDYLRLLGFPDARCVAGELWQHLIERMPADGRVPPYWVAPLRHILRHGPLARRILRAVDGDYSRLHLHAVYGELCDCLAQDRLFGGS
jgi:gamma-glutamyl:cysteine ligase YbdK (ATP-grasp superfamily)